MVNSQSSTIITNCATKIALHGLGVQTAEYVSRMLGDMTVVVERKSTTHAGVFDTASSKSRSRSGNRHPTKLVKSYYNELPRTAGTRALRVARSLELAPATLR